MKNMGDIQPVVSSERKRLAEVLEDEAADDFKLVAEVAEKFGVQIRAVYRAVEKGHVRFQGKWPMRVSVNDYCAYRDVYGKHDPKKWHESRGPDEAEREVLWLKAEGKSDSAVGQQVFGYCNGPVVKRVRKIVEVFGPKNFKVDRLDKTIGNGI